MTDTSSSASTGSAAPTATRPHAAGPDAHGAAPFERRHIGPSPRQVVEMLGTVGVGSLDELVDRTIPGDIRVAKPLDLGDVSRGLTEHQALERLRRIAGRNRPMRSYIGMGYHDTVTPSVILRNILENPGWYTAYTPYQAEIAQGRMEALLNFQTMVSDLTGMEVANASLLDEATAVAEAMSMCHGALRGKRNRYLLASDLHPQSIAVTQTRAWPLDIEVEVSDVDSFAIDDQVFGVVVQYPTTDGSVEDYRALAERVHEAGAMLVVAADPLALAVLTPPGEWGADVVVGSTQRFGLPMGFGGPHAAYFAVRQEHQRLVPGRIVGVSKDRGGRPALRLALQTREQHIRRDKATSNICTAQVLPAVLASMYAVFHGPTGLRGIARQVHARAAELAAALEGAGLTLRHAHFFDTLRIDLGSPEAEAAALERARADGMNLRPFGDGSVGISIDETTEPADLARLATALTGGKIDQVEAGAPTRLPASLERLSDFLTHRVFHEHQSETELMRYLHRLESKDLSLTTSMIPLGSCTMKLNAATEMIPVTWPGFARVHPFAPEDQTEGYAELCGDLERWLCEITGFAAVSLQPNAGSQGEYSGLLVIRRYQEARGEGHRRVCLIPTSAHGTNPASAVMAGLKVVPVQCDDRGDIDLSDLESKAQTHSGDLAALMVTYPSTHGVFEEEIRRICDIVHQHGGQVYMDGANMNAQVGLCRPGDFGADVVHLNLHKTFCIPHGGGGPGMGPIGVAEHLSRFLPGHPDLGAQSTGHGGQDSLGPVSATPYGSGTILPISWAYIAMMGVEGLAAASRIAILNANYIAARLHDHYPVLYRGRHGFVAHECILDLREMRKAGIEVDDVAKRLMDFGFHAPTVSWPVAGTVMVEPTESESKLELDRFCDALIAIRKEAEDVEKGLVSIEHSPLRHAPHTAEVLVAEHWDRPYTREQAAFPAPWTHEYKYWPPVRRIDNAFGDRHLVCSCEGMEAYAEQ